MQLLVEHEDEIAPEANDPLHDMLEELGDVPTYSTLLGNHNNLLVYEDITYLIHLYIIISIISFKFKIPTLYSNFSFSYLHLQRSSKLEIFFYNS